MGILKYYEHGGHKTDKLGRPIFIARIGTSDPTALFGNFSMQTIERELMYGFEIAQRLRYPALSLISGKRIETACSIFDLKGKSVSEIFGKDTREMLKMASTIANDNYPETMGVSFILNAPMLFKGVWAVIKGFLDEKTRAKIKILGTDYLDTVLEYVDIDNLPKFLGGNCECEGGCLIA